MRRIDRYERQKHFKNIIGCILMVALVLGGVAVFRKKKQIDTRAAGLDKDSFCPKVGILSVTAVVIDNTDALSPVQKASLRGQLEGVVNSVPQNGRLDIYAVESSRNGLVKPLFSMCSPGRKEEVSEWTSNPERVAKRWRDKFYDPAILKIEASLEQSKRDSSPIMETIQSVSISSLQDNIMSDSAQRKLVIASDMIEFGPDLNLYKGVPPVREFIKSETFRKLRGNLRRVDVSIMLFRRATAAHIQGEEFIDFWAAVLSQQGAQDVVSRPVVG